MAINSCQAGDHGSNSKVLTPKTDIFNELLSECQTRDDTYSTKGSNTRLSPLLTQKLTDWF